MSQFKIAFHYIKHQLRGYNRHGIHSPFVYDFLEHVLYLDPKTKEFDELVILRKKLLKDSRSLQITDLGAGSQINKSKTRWIKDIAKNSSKHPKYGRLFNRMVRYYHVNRVVELGTSLGLSTIYFAQGNPNVAITTLEGCTKTLEIATANFKDLGLSHINTVPGDFKDTLPSVLTPPDGADIIFFDGNHQEQATLAYFEMALQTISNKSIFIFDDIHWSQGMTNAWNKIKGHPKTVVTLDLFFVGIVFFDERLTPQEFNIRF